MTTLSQEQNAASSKKEFSYIDSSPDLDAEEYCKSLSRFSPIIRQLSKGRFHGHSTKMELMEFTLIRSVSVVRHACLCWVPGDATFVFPLSTGAPFGRGRLFGPGRQIGSLGNHEAHIVFPENFEYLIITLPISALPQYLDPCESELFIDTLAAIDSSRVDEQKKRATTAELAGIFRRIERAPKPLAPVMMQEYCQSIAGVLFDYLAYHRHVKPDRASNHERVLQRGLQLFEANPTHLYTLDELARSVFASKRAVQYAFTRIVGLSPIRFQKLHRLNLIRAELNRATPATKLAGIFANYSFTNAGRTGREYAELFGETPRATLRRANAFSQSIRNSLLSPTYIEGS